MNELNSIKHNSKKIENNVLIKVENVTKVYQTYKGFFGNRPGPAVKAVNNVSFDLERGKTLAVVGESGSGKTTLANMILKFEPITEGDILFNGESIQTIGPDSIKAFRRQVQMVFQDPASSLNPSKTLAQIIEEPMIVHGVGDSQSRKERVRELLDIVELSDNFADRYPHTLSGGQKQRVSIARAIALQSELIVLDEPTSALDVSVQATIIELLEDIQQDFGLTYFFITHDLALVRNFAHDAIVMKDGELVESGPVADIFANPQEEYTKKLLKAIPAVTPEEEAYLAAL